MIIRIFLAWTTLAAAAVAADPEELFRDAEQLVHRKQNEEAMAKVDEAVTEIDRLRAAGKDLGWHAMNGLRFAARLAREDFLDYQKALSFSNKLFELSENDYWRVPARLDRAATYRAMGEFGKAQREYDAIAEADERHRHTCLLPEAEMVLFDLGDRQRGRELLEKALMNESIHGRDRFRALSDCARRALAEGRREDAIAWYRFAEKMPFGKPEDRARCLSRAWYEQGRIEEARGRTAQAKALYRRAMELEQGEMRFRVRARDALEGIEYFE